MANEVSQLVDEYKNLANKAVENCKNIPQKLEECKTALMNLQPAACECYNSLAGDIQTAAKDMSPPGEEAGLYKNLLENYLWVSVCLLATTIVTMILGKVVGVFLGMVLTGSAAGLVAMVVLPYVMIYYIPTAEGSEEDRRMMLLVASVCAGCCLGLALAGTFLQFYPPPTWILPFGMAVLSATVGASVGGQPRHVLLGVTIGAPCGFYLVYAMMMGSMGGMFMLWTLLLGAAAAVDMQVKIAKFKGGQTSNAMHQGVSVTVFLCTSFLLTFISSTSSDSTLAESVH